MDAEKQGKADALWAAHDRGEMDEQAAAVRQVVEMLGHPQPRVSLGEHARIDDLRARLKAVGAYDGWT